jgi:hypothetical protein
VDRVELAGGSINRRAAYTLVASAGLMLATCAPSRGTSSTSPSPTRSRNASRTGERLTSASAAMRVSYRRSPGVNSPLMIREASQSATLRESSF